MPDDASTQQRFRTGVAPTQHVARTQRVYRTFALLIASLAHVAIAAPATRPTTTATTRPTSIDSAPARAVTRFHDALKTNRSADALALIAASPQPVRDAERRVKRLAATLSGPGWDFAILDAKESGDVAVVLINDFLKDARKTIDIKPWYLVRQQGEWRLLGKFTDFELKEYGFDEARLKEYRALESWAERREPELRKEQPDCGC
jgi:hypothetical protein